MQRNCQTQIYCEDPIRHPKVASGQNWDRRTSQWRQVMSNSEVAPKLASSSWSRNQYRWSWHNTKKLISKRSYIQRFRRSKKKKTDMAREEMRKNELWNCGRNGTHYDDSWPRGRESLTQEAKSTCWNLKLHLFLLCFCSFVLLHMTWVLLHSFIYFRST